MKFDQPFKLFIFLIIIIIFLNLSIKAETASIQGIPVYGFGQSIVGIFMSLCIFIPYFNDIKDIKFFNPKGNIYRLFFTSPLFVLWLTIFLYTLFSQVIRDKYLSGKLYLLILLVLCILLYFLQKKFLSDVISTDIKPED